MVLGGQMREAVLEPRLLPLYVVLSDHVFALDEYTVPSIIFGIEKPRVLIVNDIGCYVMS